MQLYQEHLKIHKLFQEGVDNRLKPSDKGRIMPRSLYMQKRKDPRDDSAKLYEEDMYKQIIKFMNTGRYKQPSKSLMLPDEEAKMCYICNIRFRTLNLRIKSGLLEFLLHLFKNSKKGSFYPLKTTQNQEKLHFQESSSEHSIRMKICEICEIHDRQYYIIL